MSSNLKRWGGPSLILGGLLWIMSYLTEIAIGLTAGEEAYLRAEPSGSVLEWFWPAFFMGAIFFLGVGLLGVHARLDGRSRVLGAIGAIPACVAVVAALINLVLLTGVAGKPTAVDGLGFAGVMGIMFGSTFLGIAAVRAKVFPRWVRFALALTVFAFIPAIRDHSARGGPSELCDSQSAIRLRRCCAGDSGIYDALWQSRCDRAPGASGRLTGYPT